MSCNEFKITNGKENKENIDNRLTKRKDRDLNPDTMFKQIDKILPPTEETCKD